MRVRDVRERDRESREEERELEREREIVGSRRGSGRGRGREIWGMGVCVTDVESRGWERRRRVGG